MLRYIGKEKMVKDAPLSEITLRKYEKPYQLDKRELIKKICLSLGLLQPGDSRDVIVDILMIIEQSSKEKNRELNKTKPALLINTHSHACNQQ